MATSTEVVDEEWSGFLSTFSNDMRGRAVSIQSIDPVSGDAGVVGQGPLLAVDYDPVGKGNDITITLGTAEVDASHTITAPTVLWKAQLDSGAISALEIIDQNGAKTIVIF